MAAVALWRRACAHIGAALLMGWALYVLTVHAPSLHGESIAVLPDRIVYRTGRWYRPYDYTEPLVNIAVAYEVRNPQPLVFDRYVILQTADFQRRRFRQTALFAHHRQTIFQLLEQRGIAVHRAE